MADLRPVKILNHGELDVKAKAVSTQSEAESHGSLIRNMSSITWNDSILANLDHSFHQFNLQIDRYDVRTSNISCAALTNVSWLSGILKRPI